MPAIAEVAELLERHPGLGYMLAAAAFLAAVSLAAGVGRRDFRALTQPAVVLKVAAAVAMAAVIAAAADAAGAALAAAGVAGAAGLARLPLYLVALGYGPTIGLLAAALFAAFEASQGRTVTPGAVLMLELAIVGWLAIFPSPRRARWAGPLDAIAAYALAWSTAGLAILESRPEGITMDGLWTQHRDVVGGAAIGALALALVAPAAYGRLFPESALGARPPADVSLPATEGDPPPPT